MIEENHDTEKTRRKMMISNRQKGGNIIELFRQCKEHEVDKQKWA